MGRIQPVTLQNAPEASMPLLEAVTQKFGKIPNVIGTLAQAPAGVAAYLGMSEALGEGELSGAERERIALVVAQENSCDYCLAAHTAIGKTVGLSAEEAIAARGGDASDPKQKALVTFAQAVVKQRGFVEDAQLEAFRAAGYTDGHVIEVLAAVALNTLTNYVNHVAETQVDFPAAPELAKA
jgi:uncharacterized peroxidase-related enzyme